MSDNNQNQDLNQESQAKKSFILKIEHTKNFTTIDNRTILDKRLSLKATGLLCAMLTYPPNWKINIEHLSKIKTDGIDSIKSALNELKDFGYVYLFRPRNEKGQLESPLYLISEFSMSEEEFKKCLPQVDFPLMDQPLVGNPPIINTNNNKYTKKIKMESTDLYEIKLTEEQRNKLYEKIGKDQTDRYIEKLYHYLKSIGKPKKYKCHYSVILNWFLKDKEKMKPFTPKVVNVKTDEDKKINSIVSTINNWIMNVTNDPVKINLGTIKIESNKIIGPHGRFYKKTYDSVMQIVKEVYKAPELLLLEINKKCNNINNISNVYKQKII